MNTTGDSVPCDCCGHSTRMVVIKPHAFVRGKFQRNERGRQWPEETCEVCGRDPRNTVHGVISTPHLGICGACKEAGCTGILRGTTCPLVLDGDPDNVVMCLHCKKPLHKSEPLTFVDNSDPGKGGCHVRCVDAYYAAKDGK